VHQAGFSKQKYIIEMKASWLRAGGKETTEGMIGCSQKPLITQYTAYTADR